MTEPTAEQMEECAEQIRRDAARHCPHVFISGMPLGQCCADCAAKTLARVRKEAHAAGRDEAEALVRRRAEGSEGEACVALCEAADAIRALRGGK